MPLTLEGPRILLRRLRQVMADGGDRQTRLDKIVELIAASMNGTVAHHEAPYGDASLVIMGNEQSGLPDHVEAACDILSRIPMREGADSLNLGIATGLMIYAALGARGYKV